ncbi:nucleotidyltransferase family protein [Pseudactinotalea suaedae]|uniref:nucleotidyltransferase family protein n=1 Tax=Pseudactinotalea suaedae TaxID=1524924 RepID=UPI001F4FD843|nr:nucleotidyltransferase domain-containing protein [Pseudactinotalea suaedae]
MTVAAAREYFRSFRPLPGLWTARYADHMSSAAAPLGRPLGGPTGRLVAARRHELREVLRRHGVSNARIFGSVARGDDREGSDLDLLVDLDTGTSLVDLVGIQLELEDLLGISVDLIPANGVTERVRSSAESDLMPL